MYSNKLWSRAITVLLEDAIQRDLVTARRAALLEILWHERYLTREQLIRRVEFRLGINAFGPSAWEDNFYRDLRVVKKALKANGYDLLYSRRARHPGYYLLGQPRLLPEYRQILRVSAAEIDARQIEIYHRLTPAERFHQGCSTSDAARKVVAYRILQENPELTSIEANQLALRRAYQP